MGAVRIFRGPLSGDISTDGADALLVDDVNTYERYPHTMATGGDITGDGLPDLAVGFRMARVDEGGEGMVFLVSGADL